MVAFPFVALNGILTSYEKFFKLKLSGIISKVGAISCTFVALAMGYGIYTLVLVNIIWNLLAISYKLYVVKRETSIKSNFTFWDFQLLKNVFSFSVWTTIISIMSRFIFNIMPSMLAAFAGASSVALFGLASTLEGYVFTFSDAVNGLFFAKTVRVANADNRDENMLSLMIQVGRINLSIVALVIVGFVVAGKEFVYLWLGEGYEIVYPCAVLMILPGVIYCPQQIARTALIAENKIKYQAWIYIAICLANVVIAAILCPIFGVLGAAMAIGITYSLRLLLMSIVFQKKLKLSMSSFFYNCHFKMILPIGITLLAGMLVFNIQLEKSWIFFIMKCLCVALIYLVSMWFLGWNNAEKRLLFSMVRMRF